MIPHSIEPRKFAQQGLDVKGDVPVTALVRLLSAVEGVQSASAELHFDIAPSKHRIVTGRVQACVDLICQRCLEAVSVPLSGSVSLALVATEADAKTLPEAYDPWVVADDEADLYDIIEEELLLALPVVAYHPFECVDKALFSAGEPPAVAAPKNNPFQALAVLKGSNKN